MISFGMLVCLLPQTAAHQIPYSRACMRESLPKKSANFRDSALNLPCRSFMLGFLLVLICGGVCRILVCFCISCQERGNRGVRYHHTQVRGLRWIKSAKTGI